jgi:thioredoxin-dependent peroxiredoxin
MKRRSLTFLVVALISTVFALVGLNGCGGATERPDGGEGLLPVGATAPDVFAPDQHGAIQRLSDQRGRALVVYFYPKDGTPGCTTEACAFRDAWDRYKAANVQVFGVSVDDRESHEKFSNEQKLPFPILADTEQTWVKAFGVSVKMGMASRVTFLIDPDGKVAKVYPDVDPGVHADEVLADAAKLTGAALPTGAAAPDASASAAPAASSSATPPPASPAPPPVAAPPATTPALMPPPPPPGPAPKRK